MENILESLDMSPPAAFEQPEENKNSQITPFNNDDALSMAKLTQNVERRI